ncbi:hypothetical protein HHK36_013894 [Tetracentron sinense]|uniref:Transmembrane protein n=1 Tax=Tetracentron sinense TaxID=13715 RepID=A0A834Z513_TETSI|nr:hypothetical protein HHK36_013894 [Tetracentron sinense]
MAKLSTIVSFALIMILLVGSHYCSASRPVPIKGMETKEVHDGYGERKTKSSDNLGWRRILQQRGRDQDVPRQAPPAPRSPGNSKA